MRDDTSAPAEVVQELTAVIASQQRLLKAVLDAIDTGRSEPLFIVRDQLRNFLADHALRIADTRPVASTLDPETVEACAKVAERLIDQRDEPCWTIDGGNYAARMNYWRDKAIECSTALKAALSPGKTGSAGVGERTP